MREYRIVQKGKKFTIEVKRVKTEGFWWFHRKTYVIWDACDSNGDSTFTLSAAEYKSLKKARKKIKKWNTEKVYHYSNSV